MRNFHARFQRQDDMLACWTAGACAFSSLVLIIVGTVFLQKNPSRLTITTLEAFHEWGPLISILRNTTAYDPRYNPPSVAQASFTSSMETLATVQDYYSRGLMTDEDFKQRKTFYNQTTGLLLQTMAVDPAVLLAMAQNYLVQLAQQGVLTAPPSLPLLAGTDPRLLPRLLATSGCSFPNAVPGHTPVTRSPGCRCIGDAYIAYVRATVNMTTNVTVKARDEGGDRLLRCLDRRVTWRTWGTAREWSVSPLSLAVYADGIFFLMCVAFLLSFNHQLIFGNSWSPEKKNMGIKFLLAVCSVGLGTIFVLDGWQQNIFQLVGIAISLAHLVFSSHTPLNYASRGAQCLSGQAVAHPLLVCFWLHAPLIIPAFIGAQAATGYIRDGYALCAVGIASFVLGLVMQRLFWVGWHVPEDTAKSIRWPLLLALLDLFVVLFLLLWVYRWKEGLYVMGHLPMLLLALLYPALLFLLLCADVYASKSTADCNQSFTLKGGHVFLFVLTLGTLVVFNTLSIIDARR